MKTALFFVDHMKTCETSFWISWLCDNVNLSGIVATDGQVHSSFRRSSLMFVSNREAFKMSRDCICFSFPEYELSTKKLKECQSPSKILYINSMIFLYESLGSKKSSFLEMINCFKEGISIYIPNSTYTSYINRYDGIVSAWDFVKWEEILKEKSNNFKECYYAK